MWNFDLQRPLSEQRRVFSGAADWFGQAGDAYSVSVGDVDNDGDIDLAVGNWDRSSVLYLNEGGIFSTTPAWQSDLSGAMVTALGDVDNDGSLDLVCGFTNGSSHTSLFLGMSNPVFIPTTTTNQLPNNSAFLRNVAVAKVAKNRYRIRLRAIDHEIDPVWIVPEYQFEGARNWYRASIVGYSGTVGPLTAFPQGAVHEFQWDVSRAPISQQNVILRLRTISNYRQCGTIRHVATYQKQLGRLDVRHPQISTSSSELSFSTVTVGDTTSLDMGFRTAVTSR